MTEFCCDRWKELVLNVVQIYVEKDGTIESLYWGDSRRERDDMDFVYCPYCRNQLQK